MSDAKTDDRPEGSAHLTATIMSAWYRASQLAVVGTAAGYFVHIDGVDRPGQGKYKFTTITLKKG